MYIGTPSSRLARARASLGAIRATIVWELLVAQRRWILLLLAVSGVSLGGFILYANAIRDAIDKAIVVHDKPLGPYIDVLIWSSVVLLFVGIAQRQVTSRIGFHIEYQIRMRLYEKLQSLDPRSLDAVATGQLMTRAVTDLAFLELFVVIIPSLSVIFLIVLALAIIIVIQSPLMAVLAVGSVPVNAWFVLRIRYRLLGMSWAALDRRARVTTAIDEAVRGIRVVKSFGREDHERMKVAERALGAYGVAMNRIRLIARYDLLLRLLPAIFTALEVLLAGRLIAGQAFTIGRLLILLYFATVLTQFAQSFGQIADAWQYARAGATRITELLDQIPPPPPASPALLGPPTTGLQLFDVGFRAGAHELLSGLDLHARHGSVVVLHGSPGSGKSLTAWIAAGRLAPTSGGVHLDDVDVSRLDTQDLASAICVVSEEPFLFGRTVRENLTLGTPYDDAALWAALRAAAADTFVADLSDQLDAVLGDRGMTLSGGQRQRLALARALVSTPRVLILDDALSAVNPALEVDIVRRVRSLLPDAALLCITRRTSLESLADQVVSLPDRTAAPDRNVAAPLMTSGAGADRGLMDAAMSVFGGELDPRLLKALSTVPADRDKPRVAEYAATASDIRPTVASVLRPLARLAVFAGVLMLTASMVNLVPQGLFKFAVDDFRDGRHATADVVAIAVAVFAAIYGLFNYAFRINAGRVSESVLYMLRRRVFQRLSRLGIDYYDRELPGQVAARVVYDLDRISRFLDDGVYFIVVNSTLLVLAMGVILVWSPPVAAVVLPFVPLLLFFSGAQAPVADRAYDRQRRHLGTVVERMQEDMAGRYVIDAFDARDRAMAEFNARALGLRSARRWSTTVSNTYVELMNTVGNLAGAALISRAGTMALEGRLSVGSMIALELYLITALGPIAFLSEALQRLMAARASFRTLRTPFAAPLLPVERRDARPCERLAGDVVLDRVTFRYPGTERVVLHDVSLEIPPGSSVALVGPTGAGKSSIAKLVARIYDPDEGAVRVDGIDVRDIDLASYRRRLGIVPQDAFCFRATVADNIRYGRPDATRDELETAVRAVGGERVLDSLRTGLGTSVEEEGRNLTGAQRQVIALARAVIAEPDVLVLDEATSSLDAATEEEVLDAVRALGRATIYITHRLPVAQRAHAVAVVDGGRIVEQGTHEDLLYAGGAYAALWSVGPEVEETVAAQP